jgi:hypothetical protein
MYSSLVFQNDYEYGIVLGCRMALCGHMIALYEVVGLDFLSGKLYLQSR